MAWWIVNFPVAPSANEAVMPIVTGKYSIDKRGKQYQKARFVKSHAHTEYMKRCHEWRALNSRAWENIQQQILKIQADYRSRKERFALRVDHYFAFEESRIWTVNSLAEQLDADNRVKPCRDALAILLGIDDKYFFSGYFEKVTTNSKDSECTIMKISLTTPRTLTDVQNLIKMETRGT